ncbi:MAG TPA: tetratricopeptide repeat protein, partial [Chloroflexota bacterium]|nr:tetratricopeptide repeat protein [Chloroflexota bacterium]
MSAETAVPFGAVLKEYRLAAGLTQEALAERACVSARNIQNLERGENRPLKDTARRLAEALGLGDRDRSLLLTAVTPVPRRRTARAMPTADHAARQPPSSPESPLPTGMLAILVADVRGYTAFTHAHGDAAGAALATRFAALAGEAVAAEGGRLVEVRGDEVLAVFTSARAALRAATGLLDRCAVEATAELPLRAGLGLDVGEPVAVPGGYRGEVINTAARLCAVAGPGEVLASEATVGLARRIEGLAYQARGELVLKGLSRPVRAWLVRPGAGGPEPVEAVAASMPAALRHNLPAALSSFIGREREQARVRALLASNRLVTLTGTGGVGKTRLALAVAEGLVNAYPDGVWLVELASLAEPAQVPGAVATALGLREQAGRPMRELLIDYLSTRRLLLLLDNCEHLVAACAALATALLRSCPGLWVMATSREGLGVAGERRYRVSSLSVPDARHLPVPELAGSYEAVRLFVARAQERRDDFVLSARNARAVGEICARLDGVPLAIELAAARVASLPVEAIAQRLDDRFKLLSAGVHGVLARHQTLRATLDWSYDLLSTAEQVLLARLAVFSGGWTLQASEAVCADDALTTPTILDLLDALVNRSLVQVDEEEDDTRYRLLETVRQYCWERLAMSAEHTAVRARHLDWCLELAQTAAGAFRGAAQGTWFRRLETEHDNLRAALDWSMRQGGEAINGLQLAAALWWFWYIRGHSEGRQWLEEALARSTTISVTPDLRAALLQGAGIMAGRHGDYERARVLHEERLAVRRTLGSMQGIASTLVDLGGIAWFQGQYDQARAYFEESLALHRALENKWGIGAVLTNLGVLVRNQGDSERARALQEESLALARAVGDKSNIAIVLGNLGVVVQEQGDYDLARDYFAESLLLAREVGDRPRMATALVGLGDVARLQGNYGQAVTRYAESSSLSRELGDKRCLVDATAGLARLSAVQGRAWHAVRLFSASDALRRAIGAPLPLREKPRFDQELAELRTVLGE